MVSSTRKTKLICLLALALLLLGSSGCSYWKSRRAKSIARGSDLFEIHCSGCHSRRRVDLGIAPPDLHGVFDRRFLPSGRSATEDVVRSTIQTGRSGIMPSFEGNLSDEDIQDIILYLHTLKLPQGPQLQTRAMRTRKSGGVRGGDQGENARVWATAATQSPLRLPTIQELCVVRVRPARRPSICNWIQLFARTIQRMQTGRRLLG